MIRKKSYSHNPGGSCASVSWSGVYKQQGYNFNEGEVFGLGSGLYLGYCAMTNVKYFDICLTSSSLVEDFLINTGVDLNITQFPNGEECLNLIKQSLDAKSPVAVQLNPNYCEGLIKVTPESLKQYLPTHWIIIVDYNEDEEILITYDNRQFNSVKISFDTFLLARNSGNSEQNPKNYYYDVMFSENIYPIESSIDLSLRKTFLNFAQVKNIQSLYVGNYGLEKLSRHIAIWDKIMTSQQLAETLKRVQLSITGAGGIKGGYRLLYAEFLKTAAYKSNSSDLVIASKLFRDSAFHWNEFAKTLKKILNTDFPTDFENEKSNLSSSLNKVLQSENDGFNIIGKLVS
jgi:hypothetical protein